MTIKSDPILKKIKQLLKVKEYQYIVFVILLLFMSFQINKKINNTNKLVCLLIGLIICIYKPVMLCPFLIFLITIYYLNKNQKSRIVIEPFELANNCEDPYLVEGINVDDVNKEILTALEKGEMECKYKSVLYKNNKTFMTYIKNNKKDIENKIYFYRSFFSIYFFDENKEADWRVINYILTKTTNFDDLIDIIDVTNTSGTFIEALSIKIKDDNGDNTEDDLLTDLEKEYKKLGMFFYQNERTNYMINNQIMNLLKNMGLYPIYMNKYIDNNLLEDETYKDIDAIKKQDKELRIRYEEIKKHIYELGILHYKAIMDIDKEDYFENVENLELDFEPYDIYDKTFTKNTTFISRYQKINEYFILRQVENNVEGKITNLLSKKDSIRLFNSYKITNDTINNVNELEDKVFIPLSKFIRDNIDRLNLLEENYYKISPNKKIAYNYLTLLFVFNGKVEKGNRTIKFTDYLGGLTEGFIIDLYKKKETIFKKQIAEEELSGLYSITSEDDLLIDNILYYYETYKNYGVKKIYPIDYHIKEKKEEKKEEEKKEGIKSITDKQQYNYQLELDSDFDSKLLEDKKKQQLEKYYELLDKEKYDSIDSLNKLAESRNKELEIENQSFTKKVDNFSTTLFALIDEITELLKKAYNDKLSTETLTLYQKYIVFFETLLNILIKEDRALHTGFLMIIIALLLYFLDNKSNNVSCGCNNNSSLSNILQLIKSK